MTPSRAGLVALVGLAAIVLPATPVRVQAPAEPAKPAACPEWGTYTAEADGAPDKGACRGAIDQAQPVSYNIPPGELFDALKAYLEQSGARGLIPINLMLAEVCTGPSKTAKERAANCTFGGIPTTGVSGTMPPREALERLLQGTSFTFMQDQTGTFLFAPSKVATVPGGRCVWKKSPWKGCPPQ